MPNDRDTNIGREGLTGTEENAQKFKAIGFKVVSFTKIKYLGKTKVGKR